MKFWPVRLVFILFSFFACGQQAEISLLLDSAKALWYKDFDKTNQLLDQSERYLELLNDSSSIRAKLEVLQCRVSSCQAFSRYRLWKENIEKTERFLLDHKAQLGNEFHLLQLDNELSRAMYYVEIHDDSRALPQLVRLQEALRALPQTPLVCHNVFLTTNYLADIYHRRGEHKAAINQNLSGVPYFSCIDPDSEGGYDAVIYRNVGLNYLEMRDFDNAKKYLNKAENIIREPLKKDPESITHHALALFESQADLHKMTGNPDSALSSIRKALPLLNLRTVRDEFKGRISLSLASLYLNLDDFRQALYYLDKAEAFFRRAGDQNSTFLAEVFLLKSDFFAKQEQASEALNYCNQSIDGLTIFFRPEDNYRPVQKVLSNKKLFNALQVKSALEEKLFVEHGQISALKEAFTTNQRAIALLDSTSIEFSLDEDRINLTGQGFRAFEVGIRVSDLLYRLTGDKKYAVQAFILMEKSKGALLLENLRMVNRFSGVSEEWISREKEIKSEMLAVEKSLYEIELGKQSANPNQLRERYADLKHQHGKLVDQFRKQSPDYFKLRYDHTVISIEAIQHQLLQPGEALIEFFVGDSVMAVAGFTAKGQYLNVKPLPPGFTGNLNEFRSLLTKSSSAEFSQRSLELYDYLLKECLDEVGQGVRSLTIIPDGLLGYIPFEVLMPAREKNNYLNDRYAIRYAYSATYLHEQLRRKPTPSKNFFAGFIASGHLPGNLEASRGRQLATIQGAEREVASIAKLVRKKYRIFNPAAREDFINHAADYKVLHFAMHSVVNDKNPMLSEMVFAEADSTARSLSAIDLYSMQLNSELAVLSACNTGMGQLQKGEGIMSFSRAFAYAGVPSAVISLWKVPDEATSKIMVGFYRHLKKGEPKDRALQLARQEFVRDNPEYAHPYFWSGFILTGTTDPLEFPVTFQWHWLLFTLLLILLIGGYAFRKRLIPGRFLSGSS